MNAARLPLVGSVLRAFVTVQAIYYMGYTTIQLATDARKFPLTDDSEALLINNMHPDIRTGQHEAVNELRLLVGWDNLVRNQTK